MSNINQSIITQLLSLSDAEYKAFISKLIPTVSAENIIGVRVPELRRLAKQLAGKAEAEEFLHSLPHRYYEENCIHAFILETHKDFDRLISELDEFLPYVDNWAVCDSMSPKIFRKYKPELWNQALVWLKDEHTYTVRYAIGILMKHFLDEDFKPEALDIIAGVKSDEYYINMMAAWYFATALCKQYDSAIKYLENNVLDKWVHNKSIRKAVESRRISEEKKAYLKTLKRK